MSSALSLARADERTQLEKKDIKMVAGIIKDFKNDFRFQYEKYINYINDQKSLISQGNGRYISIFGCKNFQCGIWLNKVACSWIFLHMQYYKETVESSIMCVLCVLCVVALYLCGKDLYLYTNGAVL